MCVGCCGGDGGDASAIFTLLLTERSSASDGYGGGSHCPIECEAAFEDDDDPVDAAAGLLLLRSVGASGMENRGERGSPSRPETSQQPPPGDRDEDSGRLARSGMKSKTLMSNSFGVLSSALPKLRSIADRFGLGTRASGDGITPCACEGPPPSAEAAAAAAATAATALGRPLLGCLKPAESVVAAAAAIALD